LEEPQRIRDFSLWPGAPLPRTDALRKLKRHEIQSWVEQGVAHASAPSAPGGGAPERWLARFATHGAIASDTTPDELGLTSLDRVALTMGARRPGQGAIERASHRRRANDRRPPSIAGTGGH
jgi:hypothetical protein